MEPLASPSSPPADLQVRVTHGPKLQKGIPIVCGFLPAGALIPNRYKIPHRDSANHTGYQRMPQAARINELANDLRKKRVDLPTAVLLNLRASSAPKAVREDSHGSLLDLGLLSKDEDSFFYVVDGQHRILALEKLIQEEEAEREKWQSFVLPFVCMLGADADDEMDQFYVVNSKAKSVRTDLAFELLKQRAERDHTVYDALLERGREWQVDGQKLIEDLADVSPIWKYRIRRPGMEKAETTISNAGFVNSLKSLLSTPSAFKRLNNEQRAKVLEAYWKGIREVLRDAFDNPTEYSIQKGVGVIAMHDILVDVIEILRAKGQSIIEPTGYTEVMTTVLNNLEGENVAGEAVKGINFWQATQDGAAGSYSSSAGKRVLGAKLRQLLPPIPVE